VLRAFRAQIRDVGVVRVMATPAAKKDSAGLFATRPLLAQKHDAHAGPSLGRE
jgi:hypothetical protein